MHVARLKFPATGTEETWVTDGAGDSMLITHALRMAACNAETILARALHGRYARAGDEACALIREALTTSGDITPPRPDPARAARPAHRAPPHPRPRRALRPAQRHPNPLPRHHAHPAVRSQRTPRHCMNDLPMSGVLNTGYLRGSRNSRRAGGWPGARAGLSSVQQSQVSLSVPNQTSSKERIWLIRRSRIIR